SRLRGDATLNALDIFWPFTLVSFFSWDGVHRVLHCFPTRRSSDLLVDISANFAIFRHRRNEPVRQFIGRYRYKLKRTGEGLKIRSEEHTSELQSRENLVCRRLLEKKKTQHTNISPAGHPYAAATRS